MECFVYILGSTGKGGHRTYVGWTNDLDRRLASTLFAPPFGSLSQLFDHVTDSTFRLAEKLLIGWLHRRRRRPGAGISVGDRLDRTSERIRD